VTAEIDEANRLLRAKGYSPERLQVHRGLGERGAVLKGTRILSPLSDDAATVLLIVRDLVPPAEELAHPLTPRELRERLP
jgi:hypothetical protein